MESGIIVGGGGTSSYPDAIGITSQDLGGRTRNAKVMYDPASRSYNMDGDRLLLIINNDEWKESTSTGFRYPPSPRKDSEYDVKRLQQCFGDVNFQIGECNNCTCNEIAAKLKHICKMDHGNTSCVAIAIMTRGDSDGQVYAADQSYSLKDTIESLLLEPKLAGIPKLFIIQVCFKGNTDQGHQIQVNGRVRVPIPTHSDCLVLMTTNKGHGSRQGAGSVMIQALCDVVDKHHRDRDLLYMMTLIHHQVASRITKNTTTWRRYKKEPYPETRFTLTKSLKL